MNLAEQDWKKRLTPEQFRVLRERDTEQPFSGRLLHVRRDGTYRCAGCGQELFSSEDKFDSESGWPSFTRPVSEEVVDEKGDNTHGMVRTEVTCKKCGGHLGHVFGDGPEPTGLRYCINSAAMEFSDE